MDFSPVPDLEIVLMPANTDCYFYLLLYNIAIANLLLFTTHTQKGRYDL